jgi:hypothetical protein
VTWHNMTENDTDRSFNIAYFDNSERIKTHWTAQMIKKRSKRMISTLCWLWQHQWLKRGLLFSWSSIKCCYWHVRVTGNYGVGLFSEWREHLRHCWLS